MKPLVLLLCLLCCSSVLAQGGLTILPVTVTIISGQDSVGLRTDAQGRLSVNFEGQWKEIGSVAPDGTLITRPDSPSLTLDAQGFFVSDEDTTPLKLDDNATISMDGLEVFRVQTSTLIEIEPLAHALPGNTISSVRIEAAPGGDKLAAYLIAIYLIMI